MAAVNVHSDFGAQENKICFHFSPFYLPWIDGTRCYSLSFWMLSFKPISFYFSFTLYKGSLVLHFLPLDWYHMHIWSCWYFSWQSWFQLMIHPAQHFIWYTLHRGSWWWTGRPGVLRFMGLQRVGHDWATELDWTELNWSLLFTPHCTV